MTDYIRLKTPLCDGELEKLVVGDKVLLNGFIYTGRDAAHKKFLEALDRGEKLPFDIEGAAIYYVGPTPAKDGEVIGSAGPTTSYRMDSFAPTLLDLGLKAMIGKGKRDETVIESCRKNKAVYLGATGGAAALIAKCIKSSEVIAYDELGAEAVRKLYVEDFPLIVINETKGNDLYAEGVKRWKE